MILWTIITLKSISIIICTRDHSHFITTKITLSFPLYTLRPKPPPPLQPSSSLDHSIPRLYKLQGSRNRKLGALGVRRTNFSSFYPPRLRVDSSLASS
ncbi:hypothetical protein HanIR_Chr03g0099801 [Helianthus annuus]|nr:hypothetical protein HanIR_Chr03g0099801 [Helianthus annuus]